MPLSNTAVSLSVAGVLTAALDLQSSESKLAFGKALSYANGTGAGQVDRLFADTRTIAASGTDDLDLAGSLTDAFGATITFVKVKAIAVVADAGNTNNVVVGAAAANQFVGPFGAATHTISVRPNGLFCAAATDITGWAVTAGTGDLLRVANSGAGTPVTYSIVILGTSA